LVPDERSLNSIVGVEQVKMTAYVIIKCSSVSGCKGLYSS